MTNYDFGEIVLVDFPQSSSAQNKKRPALVILDIGDADVVLVPVTTQERCSRGDYTLKDWDRSGLLRASCVRLAKIACLKKSDIIHHLGRLTEHDKNMVTKLWQTIYIFS